MLGFNEPNFAHQANLTPTVAARAWKHLEAVAEMRGLSLVAPATNYCDPNPNSDHAGSCTQEPAEHAFQFDAYDLTVSAGHRYNAFEWAELFYDECSAQGAAAKNCRIDYQAGHVYSYWGLGWYVDVFERKAGLAESNASWEPLTLPRARGARRLETRALWPSKLVSLRTSFVTKRSPGLYRL